MAADGGVEGLDLYGDDLNEEFSSKDAFGGDGSDLYDEVLATPANSANGQDRSGSIAPIDRIESSGDTNGNSYVSQNSINHIPRRHQLYVGNLTWWTTDQDIADVIAAIGVNDFQEVKFFENRANGQSKGFCAVSLGSEQSMRIVMEQLSKKELHGQNPVVTLPTKQALNNFEAQQKTRPTPPVPQPGAPRPPHPNMQGPPHPNMPPNPQMQGGPPRMMGQPNGPPFRPMNMQGPMGHGGPGPGGMPPRMQGPPMNQGGMPMQQQGPPPRFNNQGQGQWMPRGPGQNGPMRPMGPNGPPRQMFPGGPNPRPWMGGPQNYPPRGPQGPPNNFGPRGPMPPQMGGPPMGHQGPAPHVNPAFFNQNQPGQMQGPGGQPPNMPPNQFNQNSNMPPQRGPWQAPPGAKPPNSGNFNEPTPVAASNLSEVEFEEIMTRNRTVSSSAIARAVSDAAAGEYSSAIETLVTAISLIKQSKVAQDERCKILISSLQDTLNGIESKSYSRRERSRSRDRSYRRGRRDRSNSRDRYKDKRYSRERSRDRGDRDRGDRDRESHYRSDRDREGRERDREPREKSRSRERDRSDRNAGDDRYREETRHSRPRNKSPTPSESNSDRRYEYRSIDRERDRDRERREEHRIRH